MSTIYMISLLSILGTMFYYTPIEGTEFQLFDLLKRVKGGFMTLACNVTDAENLNTVIKFVRNSSRLSTVCSCEQRGDQCSCDTTGYTDYTCLCGPTTNITNSETKVYGIRTYITDDEDMGVWRCGSDDLGMSQPAVLLPHSVSDTPTATSTTIYPVLYSAADFTHSNLAFTGFVSLVFYCFSL